MFSLRDRDTGDVFELGNSHDQLYSANVVVGRYDVLYSVETPGADVPRNVGAVVVENVEIFSTTALHFRVRSRMTG